MLTYGERPAGQGAEVGTAAGELVRAALGVERVVPLPGKHFVQEDSAAAIAEHVGAQIG